VGKPTLWSEGEGRWVHVEITEVTSIDLRGGKVGMLMKINRAGRETRYDDGETINLGV